MAIKDFKVKNGIITGGSIVPDSDEAYDLGSATRKWKDLYLSGSTLILGNIQLKDSGGIPTFEAAGGGKVKIDLSAMTTADLAEHNTARYFTETRSRSAFSTHNGSSDYDSATGVFTLPSTTDHVTEGSNLFYTQARFDTAFTAKSTTDLSEGTNLYYTTTRHNTDFDTRLGTKSTDDLSEGSNLYYTAARDTAQFNIDLANKSTTDLSEGTNLYYTDTRFDTRLGTKSTDDLSEGSNLYYTDTRFDTRLGTKSTTDLSEGSNLYYTDARADARAQLKIDALVDAAPSQLDTLNELAAALGDDSNFSGTVSASIATKLPIITEVTVTVASATNEYGSGNKYHFNGAVSPVLHLQPGRTYRFDQSDSSNSSHPLRFSTNANNSPSATYSTGVTVVGTPGSSGAYTEIVVNFATPRLHYYCTNHSGMGGSGPDYSVNFDGAFSSLTGTPTTIAGYGITDAFDGAYGSLTGTPSTFAPAAHNQAWSTITSTPTTIAGYGITDAFDGAYGSLTGVPSVFTPDTHNQAWSTITGTPTTISGYGITDAQATLVSGTNIKTINNQSLLGSGNITVAATGGIDSAAVTNLIDSAYIQAREAAGGGSAITVQDEGSSLSTAATTLNFVGSAVTASGSGSTKTITIVGGGSGIALSDLSVTTGSAAGGGSLSYNNGTGVFTYVPADVSGSGSGTVDSTQTITLISDTVDSAYIQARQVDLQRDSAFIANIIDLQRDSAFITNIIDSDYVIARANVNAVDASFTDFKFIADSAQTTFTGNDANGNSLSFDSSNYELFINGIRLLKSDYTANPITNTIVLGTPAIDEDEVVINTIVANDTLALVNSEYINKRVRSSKALDGITTFSYSVDSGQTSFTGSDLKGNTLDYQSGDIQVYLNGILLADSDDYIATNGTSVVLNTAAPATSELIIQAYNLSLVSTFRSLPGLDIFNYTADSGQTLFQDSDISGNVLAYHPGAIMVSMNGILLQNSVDYTATSGSSITLLDEAESASELQITAFLASGAIDSSYIQSRQAVQDFSYSSLTGIPSTFTPAAHTQDFSTITNKPTTLAGYGITDGYTDADVLSVVDSAYVVSRQIRGLDSALADGFLMTSAETVTLIDSAYVLTRSPEFDYINTIDSAYVNARISTVDSAQVLGIVDSAHVRGIADSAYINDVLFAGITGINNPGISSYRYISTADQTLFSDSDINGNSLEYTVDQVQVFLNGILIINGVDYTATNGSSITLNDPVTLGSEIFVTAHSNSYIKTINNYFHNQSYYKNYLYTADSAQTFFSGVDSNGENLSLSANDHQVFVNGIRILATDFTANIDTNSITLQDAAELGDEVIINTLQTDTTSVLKITGADSAYVSGITNSIVNNSIIATVDSSYVQARAAEFDYITNIDSSYVQARVTDIDPHYVAVSSTPYTASAKERLIINTSTSITINMPNSPSFGNEVRIIDGMGTASTNNIIVSSSDKIQGSDSDLIVDIDEAAFGLVYYNSTRGWILTEK